MKKINRCLRILSLIVALSALLAVFSVPHAEEYSIPTLYIDNRAWHMSALFSLTEQNGVYLVPASFFESVDGVEISFDEARGCLLIERGEKYVSINVNTQNALLYTGKMLSSTVSYINEEYYIDSKLCADTLGFETEVTVYHEKTVLRIKTKDGLLDLKTLVERNQVSESTPPDSAGAADIKLNRQSKVLSLVADLTKMTAEEQAEFLAFTAAGKLRVSVVVGKENLTDPDLVPLVISANAQGFSFIIREKNTVEVSQCSELLRLLLKNGTRLVAAPEGLKTALDAIGYIAQGQATAKASEDPKKHNFEALTTIEINDFNAQTQANVNKWIAAAEENGVFITPLNPKTGN